MRRVLAGLATVLVLLPVVAFIIILWFNWGRPLVVAPTDPTALGLELPGNHQLRAGLPEMLGLVFIFGALIGVLATVLSFAGMGRNWRGVIDQQRHDNQRLAAANRALEGAVPVLREGYDRALGAMDAPAAPAPAPATAPAPPPAIEGGTLPDGGSLRQAALADERARRERRQGRAGS